VASAETLIGLSAGQAAASAASASSGMSAAHARGVVERSLPRPSGARAGWASPGSTAKEGWAHGAPRRTACAGGAKGWATRQGPGHNGGGRSAWVRATDGRAQGPRRR
jgi:hypothetical protein